MSVLTRLVSLGDEHEECLSGMSTEIRLSKPTYHVMRFLQSLISAFKTGERELCGMRPPLMDKFEI